MKFKLSSGLIFICLQQLLELNCRGNN